MDITEADAAREGFSGHPAVFEKGIDDFAEVWDSLNTRKGTRWQDNPDVWVLTFEYVGEARP